MGKKTFETVQVVVRDTGGRVLRDNARVRRFRSTSEAVATLGEDRALQLINYAHELGQRAAARSALVAKLQGKR